MKERARVVATVIAIAVLAFYGATTLYVQLVGVPSIAVLRLLPAAQYPDISLTGYRSTNDGGQGTFVYNGSATCTDDGGTLIQAVGGCYQRLVGNLPYSPQWFGAYCGRDDARFAGFDHDRLSCIEGRILRQHRERIRIYSGKKGKVT